MKWYEKLLEAQRYIDSAKNPRNLDAKWRIYEAIRLATRALEDARRDFITNASFETALKISDLNKTLCQCGHDLSSHSEYCGEEDCTCEHFEVVLTSDEVKH